MKYLYTITYRTKEAYKFGLFHIIASNTKTAIRNFRHFIKLNRKTIIDISREENPFNIDINHPIVKVIDVRKDLL